MKKIISVLAIMPAIVLLSSCNSFEQKAKEQMHKTLKSIAKNPATLKISDEKVMLSNDSICIIQFLASNENEFGGKISTYMEYVYMNRKYQNGERKLLENIKIFKSDKAKQKSVGSHYKKMIDGTESSIDKEILDSKMEESKMTLKDAAADICYHLAAIDCLTEGREVPNN